MIAAHPDCPQGIALLADHLDCVLAQGEDLLAMELAPRADLDAGNPQEAPEAFARFVRRLMQLEAALLLRLFRSRRLAAEIGRADPSLRMAATLFRAETDVLETLMHAAIEADGASWSRSADPCAYLRARGMISPEAGAPSPYEALAVTDAFKLGGVARLGQVLDLVSSLLDLLDARFGLYPPDLLDDVSSDEATRARGEAAVAVTGGANLPETVERPAGEAATAAVPVAPGQHVAGGPTETPDAADPAAPADVSGAAAASVPAEGAGTGGGAAVPTGPRLQEPEEEAGAERTPHRSLAVALAEGEHRA